MHVNDAESDGEVVIGRRRRLYERDLVLAVPVDLPWTVERQAFAPGSASSRSGTPTSRAGPRGHPHDACGDDRAIVRSAVFSRRL